MITTRAVTAALTAVLALGLLAGCEGVDDQTLVRLAAEIAEEVA